MNHGGGRILAGFFVSGFLLSLLGAILPAWGYHRDPPAFDEAGTAFLTLASGLILSGFAGRLWRKRGLSFLLVFSCALSCAALGYLAAMSPPAPAWLRAPGLLALGLGAGLLNLALFHAVTLRYHSEPAETVTLGGVFYGLGCLAATLLVAGAFYAYTVPSILLFMAAVPGVFAAMYAGMHVESPPPRPHPSVREAFEDFRSPAAVLFALLLFFQFGNEWAIAGWLPLFLIRRVGLSPSAALMVLAAYWFFLLTGRLGAIAILKQVRHARLLGLSVVSALFGCLVLYSTNNRFGAATGAFFLGAGFASIYPLVAEKIGRRFPYYHPGFFNGIFTFALMGGLLAPATLGYAAEFVGIGVVMAIPLVGTILVMALLLLIWLESKITGP